MDNSEQLMKLQVHYETLEEYGRFLKNNETQCRLKSLKSDFERMKQKYLEESEKLNVLREKYMNARNRLELLTEELCAAEAELGKIDNSNYRAVEELYLKGKVLRENFSKIEDENILYLEEEEKISAKKEELKIELMKLKEAFYKYKELANQEKEKKLEEFEKSKEAIEKIRAVLPGELLKKYDSIKEKKKNAVARLQGGVCTCCRVRVSSLTMDNINRKGEVICCDNCGRFLYFNPDNLGVSK